MASIFAKRDTFQKTRQVAALIGAVPAGYLPLLVNGTSQFFALHDFELMQDLPIAAIGQGVFDIVSSHCVLSDPRSMEHRRADGGPLTPPAGRRT